MLCMISHVKKIILGRGIQQHMNYATVPLGKGNRRPLRTEHEERSIRCKERTNIEPVFKYEEMSCKGMNTRKQRSGERT